MSGGIFGLVGAPYPAPARSASAGDSGLGRSYEAARRTGMHANWRVPLKSHDAAWLPDRDDTVAKARDLGRNEGIGASATQRTINSAVGFRWDFTSKPNWKALKITYEAARELGSQIDALWEQYAYGIHFLADARRTLTFGQLLRLSAAHIFNDGEMVGLIEWAEDEETRFRTRLRIVNPDRLSNPSGRADGSRLPNGNTITAGVEKNAAEVPVRYWIREGHPNDLGGAGARMNWNSWERYSTNLGRPQVLHAFDKLSADQTRGVTRFASCLKLFRSFSKFSQSALDAAAANALNLGFIKSNAGPSAVSDAFSADELAQFAEEREGYYEDNPVEVDGVQWSVLGPDDEVQMPGPARDVASFDGFTRAILRLIAAALGVTYEELSMDFSTTNYSSARAALLIAWKETLALRGLIEQQIAWPFFAAWLEEAFDVGALQIPAGAPDFYDAIDAYVEGRWRGPGRGHIDPTKEIVAAAARMEAGITTLEDECADYDGSDWQEKLEQKAREVAARRDLELDPAPGMDVYDDDPEAARQRDARPGSALRQAARTAHSPAHSAEIDARPAAAA